MAKFDVPCDSGRTSDDTQKTNQNTPERVEAVLAKEQVAVRYAAGGNATAPEVVGQARLPDSPQDLLSFDKLNLSCDPRVRLFFKHAEGNSAINIEPEAIRQEISTEPAGILRRPVDPLVVKLLGSLQSRCEIKCVLAVKSMRCELYYSPNSDNAILVNRTSGRISVKSSSGSAKFVDPWGQTTLSPASWTLSLRGDTVDLKLLPRRYSLKIEEKTTLASASGKRLADTGLCGPGKKTKLLAGPSSHMVDSKAISCPETVWAGVDLQENQLVKVTDRVTGHVEYSIRRLASWAFKRTSREAFTAILDDGTSKPEVVVVKIIATPYGDNASTINAAKAWLQEFKMHRSLEHPCIAGLRGWDARMLSLFVEYKEAKDLGSHSWRTKNGYFQGNLTDARCILTQISSALQYLEERGIAHNDIKPGNILYTRTEWPANDPYPATSAGAVLIDFGLASSADSVQGGGTPWYLPPEYTLNKRGLPGDVFSLGVVMLYVMRRIPLPETWDKYRPWPLHRAKEPTNLAAMRSWQDEVHLQAEALSSNTIFARQARLYDAVRHMLAVNPEDRVTASELVEETKSW
ncbi:Serine/threonine-protein kinase tousled-like 2 [Cytospora mali]|uniref:Serine/threonine-protein kinase tousled-like 2 n=1 Tax=Cytospora mali TaxID=578113 RepID=A0A194VJF3_CYTMA|nr:Serine/threonine-protein kinase tousled-like 2 [Valsa mali]